jgi:hypothetical protein
MARVSVATSIDYIGIDVIHFRENRNAEKWSPITKKGIWLKP